MPVTAVQRNALWFPTVLFGLVPTTTEPSALTALAPALPLPGRVPRLTTPVAAVQRNARLPELLLL
jgi:hypothetical protein